MRAEGGRRREEGKLAVAGGEREASEGPGEVEDELGWRKTLTREDDGWEGAQEGEIARRRGFDLGGSVFLVSILGSEDLLELEVRDKDEL